MHLSATANREVAQTLAFTISEWVFDSEARTASSVFKVRTGLECHEDNLRELKWDNNPNHGITRKTNQQTNKQKTILWKALMQDSDLWHICS